MAIIGERQNEIGNSGYYMIDTRRLRKREDCCLTVCVDDRESRTPNLSPIHTPERHGNGDAEAVLQKGIESTLENTK